MAETPSLIGSAIADRYTLERKLGEGAAAIVYLARDQRHDREVAIKVLHPSVAAAVGAERFEREIALTARLSHPHIVPMLDAGEWQGLLYFVMPLLRDASLRDQMKRQGQLAFEETLQITRDVAVALDYAHSHGVVHRDIKPENILIGGGTAVVADLGIAKVVSEGAGDGSLTGTGIALGTVLYMSPEQATASHVDARSDVYALGCMVYEMLAGEPPYTGANPQSVLAKHLTAPVPAVRSLRPSLPPNIDEVLATAMAKTPADRFATAGEFASALARTRITASSMSLGATPLAPPAPAPRPRKRLVVVAAALLAVVAVAILSSRTLLPPRGSAGSAAESVRSIAVLPFDDVSQAKDQEYFATGIADELLTALARLPNLRIAARTSSYALRGSNLAPQEIGRRLRVTALLTGSVRKDGDRLRISAELIDIPADTVMWTETFDEQLRDVFAVQEQIAQTIVRKLQLLESPAGRIVPTPTADLAAYELYLRGRLEWTRRTANSLRDAVRYFKQAIARDSMYAKAWAGLADTYNVIGLNFYGPPGENFRLGVEAARRAVALDSTLADAHAAFASAVAFDSRDWETSEASYLTAIRLDPTYPTTYYFYSIFLSGLGRFEESVANAVKARELEPSSAAMSQAVGMAYVYGRHFEEAVAPLKQAIALQPGYYFPYAWYAIALGRLQQKDSALAAARHAVRLAPDNVLVETFLGQTFALVGERDSAYAVARRLEARRGQQSVPNVMIARLYAILGDKERAFAAIDHALKANEAQLSQLRVPGFEALEGDPRYEAILRRLRLK